MWTSNIRTRISELRAELETARALELEAIMRRCAVEARLEELENLIAGDRQLAPMHGGLPTFVTTEARGRRMIAILECLAEVFPSGLTTPEIIERARRRAIELNPGSTRAQLSQAQRRGWVHRDGRRYILTVTGQPNSLGSDS
jgi:hypothetical protein